MFSESLLNPDAKPETIKKTEATKKPETKKPEEKKKTSSILANHFLKEQFSENKEGASKENIEELIKQLSANPTIETRKARY